MRHSENRFCVLALAAILVLLAPRAGISEEYAVDEFVLGGQIVPNSPAYKAFKCVPSTGLAGIIECFRPNAVDSKTQEKSSVKLFHTKEGKIIFVSVRSEPRVVNEAVVRAQVFESSKKFGTPANNTKDDLGQRLVTWGSLRLEEISSFTDEFKVVQNGGDPRFGILLDPLDDLRKSAGQHLPVLRTKGGEGFAVIAGFDKSEKGFVRRLAVDASEVARLSFDSKVAEVLRKDQALPKENFSLWPLVARAGRQLALDVSVVEANAALDRMFASAASKKLYSHVWPLLPLSVIKHLEARTYWALDVFGDKSENPKIRDAMKAQLKQAPSEPFSEFLQYALGDFDKALAEKPTSLIRGVLLYGRAHRAMHVLLRDAYDKVATAQDKSKRTAIYAEEGAQPSLNDFLRYLNHYPERYNSRPLAEAVPGFEARAAEIQRLFVPVLEDRLAPHYDDAGYMLGWLAFHRGNLAEAAKYMETSMTYALTKQEDTSGRNRDYLVSAEWQMQRYLKLQKPGEQVQIVRSRPAFNNSAILWHAAIRSLYLAHDYPASISACLEAMKLFGVSVDRLPVTTDPKLISSALERMNAESLGGGFIGEIAYMLQASREAIAFEVYLKGAGAEKPASLTAKITPVITKYSLMTDPDVAPKRSGRPKPEHKDLRQAIYLTELALSHVPKSDSNLLLRSWLHYRRVHTLSVFAPQIVAGAVADFRQEFPASNLVDDMLAEQVFAEAIGLRDLKAAKKTFDGLLREYPDGNAVDNAHSWMAIGYTCTGSKDAALKMNREIIRRFPLTRHAMNARERLLAPVDCNDMDHIFDWDYFDMKLRERQRIDAAQKGT